jgi:hypothetical protein
MNNIIEKSKDKSEYSSLQDVDDLQNLAVVGECDYKLIDLEEGEVMEDGDFMPPSVDDSNYETKREIRDGRNFPYHYHTHRDIGDAAGYINGLVLTKYSLNLNVGDTKYLSWQILSTNEDIIPLLRVEGAVTYYSDNESVATVAIGGGIEEVYVTGVSEGTANIIFTTKDGNYNAVCAITVED